MGQNLKIRANRIFLSYDFGAFVFVLIAEIFLIPSLLPCEFILSYLVLSTQVLSLMFSVYFAGYAVIASATDDEFIEFLEERGVYSELLWSMKYSIVLLFLTLVISILFYVAVGLTAIDASAPCRMTKWVIVISGSCFAYSLTAAFLTFLDAVRFAQLRVKYRAIKQKNRSNLNTDESQ